MHKCCQTNINGTFENWDKIFSTFVNAGNRKQWVPVPRYVSVSYTHLRKQMPNW